MSADPCDSNSTKWDDGTGIGESLSPRDYFRFLEADRDVQAQLIAIYHLISRNRQADSELKSEIKAIAEVARNHPDEDESRRATDEWVDQIHHSVYQDAAHSMAAVGMIAPFLESIIAQSFVCIGRNYFSSSPPNNHPRWQSTKDVQWDCHQVIENGTKKRDLVAGTMQLVDATGVRKHLPVDFEATFAALIAYRNKMFHCGFEWPNEELENFEQRLAASNWPRDWFARATRNDQPWVFYMTDKFVDHALDMTWKVLEGFGAFVRDDLIPTLKPLP